MTDTFDDLRYEWFLRSRRAREAEDRPVRQDHSGHAVAFADPRPTALVVEDDGIVASSIERVLRAQALDVTVVRDAEQGLEAFRSDPAWQGETPPAIPV